MALSISDLELTPYRSWEISSASGAWWVASGKIDIFLADRMSDGETGLRHHLFRVQAGELIFGLSTTGTNSRFLVLAQSGPDTETRVIDDQTLQREFHEDWIKPLLARWLQHLCDSIAPLHKPRVDHMIEVGTQQPLPPDIRVLAHINHPLWVSVTEGDALWQDEEAVRQGTPYLASSSTWLKSLTPLVVDCLDISDTGAFNLEATLAEFYSRVLQRWATRTEGWHAGELDRQQQRCADSQRLIMGALTQLAAPLATLNVHAGFTVEVGLEDPMVAAFRLVAQAAGAENIVIPVKKPGAEAALLDQLSRASGLNVRQVTLSGAQWWNADIGPLLAYLKEDNQPVAILPDRHHGALIVNPADGQSLRLDETTAARLAETGFMFFRTFPRDPQQLLDVLKFGLKTTLGDWFIVVMAGLLGGILGLIMPMITGELVSTVIPDADKSQLLQLSLILLVTGLISAVFGLANAICLMRIEARMGMSVNAAVMDRLIHLPANFFRDFTAGDLASRALGMDSILRLMTGTVLRTILSGIFSIFNLFYLFYLNVDMALVALGITIVATAVTTLINLQRLGHERLLTAMRGKIEGDVFQSLTGITKLRVAAVEDRAFARWAGHFAEMNHSTMKAKSTANLLSAFNAGLPVLGSLGIFLMMSLGDTKLDAGGFISFNASFSQFLSSGIGISAALTSMLQIIPLYERMKPIFETSPEVDELKPDAGELDGAIELSSVTFGYPGSIEPVLKNVSLNVAPGEFVALVGPSGCGKSTLLRLLLGFEKPQAGTVFYDDQDLQLIDVVSVRKQIGIVLQNGKLMPGSIYSNIVGSGAYSVEEAMEAVRMAGMEEDLRAMPMGIHTLIAEGATTLSGGQKQRLMIARALVSKPKILFFDEATSALDNRTQALVSHSVDGLNATRVVIAHRLSTIRHADRIVVMDKGQIMETGHYEELMALNGLFAQFAKRQLV